MLNALYDHQMICITCLFLRALVSLPVPPSPSLDRSFCLRVSGKEICGWLTFEGDGPKWGWVPSRSARRLPFQSTKSQNLPPRISRRWRVSFTGNRILRRCLTRRLGSVISWSFWLHFAFDVFGVSGLDTIGDSDPWLCRR
jgi:hypothetical protein